jgi:hypothetical protein
MRRRLIVQSLPLAVWRMRRLAAKNWQRGVTRLEVDLIFRCFRATTFFLNGKESDGFLEVISRDIKRMNKRHD